ncbi:MAG TPA: choice-of-anchor L domain-containing protein, partial [Flavobacterium sp.]
MKKSLLTLLLFAPFYVFSQAITVNTSSYTVPQLVNNVLINSPCVSATNVTWRTGTNFGSANGIGFFQNTNAAFPMQGGVILSTGNVHNAPGPNSALLNDGSALWTGDTDLEQTLGAAGISMVSTNATVLEFDFTPISSQFNFDFVFASEEYGNFQCQFSDAFAFLLTNVNTGVTTNLAVVPNTNTPISVVTIRDFIYNSSCNSQNQQYFGSYNGGSQAAGSATNFNGQTVMLNATSTLIPNTPYHIKLVIADRSDHQSDSAIFISSDSFNIGQDVLGLDLTVANSSAICQGGTYNLSTGLNPSSYTFSWTKDGVTIPGATGPSISVTQPGYYSVTYTNILNICQPVTDIINIEYYPQFTTPNPVPLYKCNTGAATYIYDLAYNTPIVTAGITAATQVSYHASQADANNNLNPLPLSYSSAPGQTVYVRIKNSDTQCFVVKSFILDTID